MTLITVEGLDGCGSTTVVEQLGDEYTDCVTTKEPTDSKYGQLLRENLGSDTDPIADLFLFMADRRRHTTGTIVPHLEDGNTIISDRYVDSTRAYQPVVLAGDSDEPFDSVWQAKFFIEQLMKDWLIEPDLVIYLDVSVDTAMSRSSQDEKYENRAMLEQVKKNYDALADMRDNIVTIDGEQSEKDVLAAVKSVLAENLDDQNF